jgi:fucose permease
MTSFAGTQARIDSSSDKASPVRYDFALTLVIRVFFVWSLTYGLLDVLSKHFSWRTALAGT